MLPVEPMSAERIAEFEMRLTVKPLFNQTRPYAEVAEFIAEVKRLQTVEAELRELLGCFGVDDSGWQANEPRIKYFDAQVDKVDWARIQAVMGKGGVK